MEWNGPAYQPTTNTLFVASVDWCGTFTRDAKEPQYTQRAHHYGGAVTPDSRAKARGWLQAITLPTAPCAGAAAGARRWSPA